MKRPIHIRGPHPAGPAAGKCAVFLDRDGVVNTDFGYVGTWERFRFEPGAVESIVRLGSMGFRIVIVTNQAGIARGYYTEADYRALTERMLAVLASEGAAVDAVYACPHHPETPAGSCTCRKPAPGMLLAAMRDHDIGAAESILVGDKMSDIEAARRAGIGSTFLITHEPPSLEQERKTATSLHQLVFDKSHWLLRPSLSGKA